MAPKRDQGQTSRVEIRARLSEPGRGWKLHINVDSNDRQAVSEVERVAKDLVTSGVITTFKIANGGGRGDENGKEATLYAGSMEHAVEAANLIESKLNSVLAPPDAAIMRHDLPLSPKGLVWGRFEIFGLINVTEPNSPAGLLQSPQSKYHQYGMHGLSFLNDDMKRLWPPSDDFTEDDAYARAREALTGDCGEIFTGGAGQLTELETLGRMVREFGPQRIFGWTPTAIEDTSVSVNTEMTAHEPPKPAPTVEWWR